MIARRVLGGLAVAPAALSLFACTPKPATPAQPKEITFSILSAENQASMGPLLQPLLADMSAQIGIKAKPFFASNYTALIEAMRFKPVHVGWFSALPALESMYRANCEVLTPVIY